MNADPANPARGSERAPAPVADPATAAPATPPADAAAQRDQYLRLAADFENFRKRSRRDSEQQAAAEKDAFIHELLSVLDNLERALAAEPLAEGAGVALQQLGQLLHRHGIEPGNDLGRPFDPHRQEAVSVRHDPLQSDRVVLEVAQRGYCRGEQVFRPAKVIVNET